MPTPVPEHPREAQQRGFVGGEGVGLLLVPQLQAVLDGAQEAVGVGERRSVADVDVAGVHELCEGLERGGRPDARVVAAVHELEELHRELDVADASATALELAFRQTLSTRLAFGTRLHHPDLAHGVGRQDVGPDERLGAGHELGAERVIPGHGSRLQQRLELPGLRRAFPVRGVAVDGAGEGARSTVGTEVGVGAEHDPVGRRFGHDLEQPAHRLLGFGDRAVVHEEHVDVGRVVQLGSAELAHPDHGDAHPGLRDRERALETRFGEGGELAADGREVGLAEQVARRDPQELPSLPTA